MVAADPADGYLDAHPFHSEDIEALRIVRNRYGCDAHREIQMGLERTYSHRPACAHKRMALELVEIC